MPYLQGASTIVNFTNNNLPPHNMEGQGDQLVEQRPRPLGAYDHAPFVVHVSTTLIKNVVNSNDVTELRVRCSPDGDAQLSSNAAITTATT